MKKLIVLLLFSWGISVAQTNPTLTVSGTTYQLTGTEILTIANSYASGYREGVTFGRYSCNQDTYVQIDLADDTPVGMVNLETFIGNRTEGLDPISITWELRRWNGEVIDITDSVSSNGDISFGYRNRQGFVGPLDPVEGFVQYEDAIIVNYRDSCGVYVHEYRVPSSAPAIRTGNRPRRPPKVRRPV